MPADVPSIDPRTGDVLAVVATETDPAAVTRLSELAIAAAAWLEGIGRDGRARLLSAIADELDADGEAVIAAADRESALGTARLTGEFARTTFQLRFFSEVVEDGGYLEAIVDHADPEAKPVPRPDLRRMLVPIGPVAVFGASNFPLAFSVAGGDTASALAAGCPVLVKAHPAHPRTSERVAAAIRRVLDAADAPEGVFTLVHGQEAGRALVTDPRVRAVGFTGSLGGGRALYDLATSRPEPIPFYGELGSVNPVIVTPAAVAARAAEIGKGAAASVLMSVGQFCTKPGLFFVPAGADGDVLVGELTAGLAAAVPGTLLTAGIRAAFLSGTAAVAALPGVEVLQFRAEGDSDTTTGPVLLQTTTTRLGEADAEALLEEQFGPFAIVVRYTHRQDLLAALDRLPAGLTATIHGEEADATDVEFAPVFAVLRGNSGRVLWNGYPTGVAVTWAMQHGGPYPATTAADHTSVGATAIRRWLRPVTYQSVPEALLPVELRDGATGVPRRVDGKLELG